MQCKGGRALEPSLSDLRMLVRLQVLNTKVCIPEYVELFINSRNLYLFQQRAKKQGEPRPFLSFKEQVVVVTKFLLPC